MNNLFTLLIQSSIALLLFYLVYWIFLRKETFYVSNRFYLVFALVLSILMPLIPIQYTVLTQASGSDVFAQVGSAFKNAQPYVGSGFESVYSLHWLDAILIVYITGAAIFMLRLLVQTAILIIQILKNKIRYQDGLRIVETEKYGLPFSFFNVVYINPKFHKQDVLPEILAHEKVHIRERHWVDLLIIELLTVIFWFNPIIWFFEHAIKLNHEYLADHGVISNGSHVGKYQALLVNQLMGMQIIGLTNNLNFGINTNRLKMMTKQKSPQIKSIKMIWVLPIVALLLYAFAEPNYEAIQNNVERNKNVSQNQKEIKISGTIVDENGDPFPGVQIVVKGTMIGTTTDIDGTFKLKIQEEDKLAISFIGYKSINFTAEKLFLQNNKIVMEKAAIILDLDRMFFGDPPPPPPKIGEGKKDPPPPPPRKNINDRGEEEIFMVVERMPEYPGGFKALGSYITGMLEKLTKSENIKGKARIFFTVDNHGNAGNVRIISKDNEQAAKGAVTIIENMERWIPGEQRGKAVKVDFILPLEFK